MRKVIRHAGPEVWLTEKELMPVAQNLSSRGREIRSRFTADPEKRFFIMRPPDFPSLDGSCVNHERDYGK